MLLMGICGLEICEQRGRLIQNSFGLRVLLLLFILCHERWVHGAAVELGEAQVAVKADALHQGFTGCGIERSRHVAYSTISCRRAAAGETDSLRT
jgi:hypothetical protein